MKNELDSKLVLSVFEKIREHGSVNDGAHMLEGIKASTDFDGYTLFLKDATVTLSYGFHNQYHFDYQTNEQLEQFEKKIKYIASHY